MHDCGGTSITISFNECLYDTLSMKGISIWNPASSVALYLPNRSTIKTVFCGTTLAVFKKVIMIKITRKPNATLKILTSEEKLVKYTKSPDYNFILNEIGKLIKSRFKKGQIFYMKKDMSISHAKIFCSETSLFVGSANLKKDSITENFEAGIYTERKDLIKVVMETIDFIVEGNLLECIFNTDRVKSN